MNSINNKRYERNNPIQISIYDDKIYVWNDAIFPEELKNKNLFEKNYSKPYNPLMEIFYLQFKDIKLYKILEMGINPSKR